MPIPSAGRRGALLGFGGAFWLGAAGSTDAPEPVQVAPGVFVLPGVQEDASRDNDNAIANVGFIVGADSVAVVDPGGSVRHGRTLRRAVEAATPLPIRYVILTHAHPDHVMGGPAFADPRTEVVGHARLPDALAQRRDSYLRAMEREMGAEAVAGSDAVVPTRLVEDRLDLDLGGGRVLALTAHDPAHTDADLSLFDPVSATLWLSDLLFVERIPSLDGSLAGWLRELAALRQWPAARAVPGHGPPAVPWPQAAAAQVRYLEAVRDGTRAAVAAGIGIAEAPGRVATAEAARWRMAEQYHGRNVSAAYRELEWE